MTTSQPSYPRPIYDGNIETIKMYCNGKEFHLPSEIRKDYHGILDAETGELKLFPPQGAKYCMKTIIGDRHTGKTTELIRLCKKMNEEHGTNDTIIVVCNLDRARAVAQMADDLGYLSMPFPCTFEEIRRRPPTYYKNVLIDDMDTLVQQLIGNWRLAGYTVTAGD